MRILGFSQMWPKLKEDQFTTYRFPRKDKDWQIEEVVQVVFKPRTKDRVILGIARIIRVTQKDINNQWSYYPSPSKPNTPDMITPWEAEEDGFEGQHGGGDVDKMRKYFQDAHGYTRCDKEMINKLQLYWIERNGN